MTENISRSKSKGIRSFVRNSGDFELTEFEIAGFDCTLNFNPSLHNNGQKTDVSSEDALTFRAGLFESRLTLTQDLTSTEVLFCLV